jgi:hypothetical protein
MLCNHCAPSKISVTVYRLKRHGIPGDLDIQNKTHFIVHENRTNIDGHSKIWIFDILLYKSQQDAQVTEFILYDNCSTCFGRHYHPSSGAQNNCNYSIW